MRKEFKFYSSKKRFFGLFALIFTVFAIVIGRLVWLQIVRGDAMARQSMAQAMGTDVMYSPRGAIVDCNGEELAVSIMAKSLYVDPVEMEDRPDSAAAKSGRNVGGRFTGRAARHKCRKPVQRFYYGSTFYMD